MKVGNNGFCLYVTHEERNGKHYCSKCHTWFDDYHIKEVEESRGEYWGIPCSERVVYRYCPNCHADEYDGYLYDSDDIIEEELDNVTKD